MSTDRAFCTRKPSCPTMIRRWSVRSNMDFRSFFLHFECATCFYNSSVVAAVKQDIMETINVSRRIDDEWLRRVPWIRSIMASVLRLFAPLL